MNPPEKTTVVVDESHRTPTIGSYQVAADDTDVTWKGVDEGVSRPVAPPGVSRSPST